MRTATHRQPRARKAPEPVAPPKVTYTKGDGYAPPFYIWNVLIDGTRVGVVVDATATRSWEVRDLDGKVLATGVKSRPGGAALLLEAAHPVAAAS
jgi:hypothetical protein